MAVVRIFAVYLAGLGPQQVLQGPKAVLDPVTTLPHTDLHTPQGRHAVVRKAPFKFQLTILILPLDIRVYPD